MFIIAPSKLSAIGLHQGRFEFLKILENTFNAVVSNFSTEKCIIFQLQFPWRRYIITLLCLSTWCTQLLSMDPAKIIMKCHILTLDLLFLLSIQQQRIHKFQREYKVHVMFIIAPSKLSAIGLHQGRVVFIFLRLHFKLFSQT